MDRAHAVRLTEAFEALALGRPHLAEDILTGFLVMNGGAEPAVRAAAGDAASALVRGDIPAARGALARVLDPDLV